MTVSIYTGAYLKTISIPFRLRLHYYPSSDDIYINATDLNNKFGLKAKRYYTPSQILVAPKNAKLLPFQVLLDTLGYTWYRAAIVHIHKTEDGELLATKLELVPIKPKMMTARRSL